ncbi:MAG: magnesium and cobalt transport protein CorA [Rikenellaceae bacterium]|jgi:magnesium transporter|nr:magnesium and cobalt transport protein CorA [Rikenellaceae bacterium]
MPCAAIPAEGQACNYAATVREKMPSPTPKENAMITIYLKQHNKIVRNADIKMFDELGYDDILWIDLLEPTLKEQKAVEGFLEINLQTRQQIEEIESTSKYSETENAIISNSNFFIPSDDNFAVEPVSFIVAEGMLVSVRNSEFRTFNETAKKLQMSYRSFPTGYHLLILILEVRIDYDADLVESLARQIAALSRDLNQSESVDNEILRRINHLQENTMLVRENIFDRQRILSGILRSERFPNDIYPKLTLMIKDVNSLISHADFDSERLDYLQDTALGLINLEQNKATKIFSVAALFFMPPTMIASIYGMNFAHIPGSEWRWGFAAAIGLMAVASIATYYFFKWKKWL